MIAYPVSDTGFWVRSEALRFFLTPLSSGSTAGRFPFLTSLSSGWVAGRLCGADRLMIFSR